MSGQDGYLRIIVVQGKSLGGKENYEGVYCALGLVDSATQKLMKRTIQKTKKNKKNQPWNETFEFVLEPQAAAVVFKVRSKGITTTHKIGEAVVPFEKFPAETETEMLIPLEDKHHNDAGHLQIRYTHFKKQALESNPALKDTLQRTYSKKEMVKGEKRTKRLNKLFNLPPNERILQKYDCYLESHSGELYVSDHYLFFVSKRKRVSIRFFDTEVIEMKQPNSLRIVERDGKQEFLFTNLKRIERVYESIRTAREGAVAKEVPVADVNANEDVTEDFVSETEAESSELDTTDDEGFRSTGPSPHKNVYLERTYSQPATLSDSCVDPKIADEVNQMMEIIEARRASERELVSAKTVIQPQVTGITLVPPVIPVSNKRGSLEGGLPTDEDKELNLSPKPDSVRNRNNSGPLLKEISPSNTPVVAPAAILASQPTIAVAKSVSPPSDTVVNHPPRDRKGFGAIHSNNLTQNRVPKTLVKEKLSGLQQQVLLMPLLTAVCFLVFAFISNWCGIFCGILAATVMGGLMSILQPGKVSVIALDFLVNQMGQKKLSDPSISWAVQAALAGLVCWPLQLVSTGFATIRLGWFGAVLSTFIIGTASTLLEYQVGLGNKPEEKKKA